MKAYSSAEVELIHAQLPHGQKKTVASLLGIKPAALSRYLNQRKNGYRMPEFVYSKILEFINNR